MKTLKCRGRLCMLVCGWLWISGLLLMGKVLGSLSQVVPSSITASKMDAVGVLQIFFLLFTAACAGLYFTWNRQVSAGSRS
jgi:hypothetical protein